MYVADFVRVLLRRWLLVLPLLAATGFGALHAARSAHTSYRASMSVVLLPPTSQPGTTDPLNPFLEFNASLNTTARLLSNIMTSDNVVRRMVTQGAVPTYEVGTGSEGPSPILNIVATAPSPADATRTLQIVSQGIKDQLMEMQRDVRAEPRRWIEVTTVSSPSDPVPQFGAKVRAVVGVAGAGLLVTFTVAFLGESVLRRRQEVKAARLARRNAHPVEDEGQLVTEDDSADLGTIEAPVVVEAQRRQSGTGPDRRARLRREPAEADGDASRATGS